MPSYKWQVVIFWSSKITVQAICVVLFIHKHNDDGTAKQLDFFLTASKNKLTVLCFAGSRWNRNVSGREGNDIDVPFTPPIAILFFCHAIFRFSIKAYHMLYNNCHQSGVGWPRDLWSYYFWSTLIVSSD